MRSLFLSRDQKRQNFNKVWKPIIEQAKKTPPESLPEFKKKQAPFFIDCWNDFYEKASEDEKIGLAVLAYRVNIHRYAAGMLIDGAVDTRLSGIRILGYMRDESAWKILSNLAKTQDNNSFPNTLNSLLLINKRRAREELPDILNSRHDWPISETAMILSAHQITDLGEHFQNLTELTKNISKTKIEALKSRLRKS